MFKKRVSEEKGKYPVESVEEYDLNEESLAQNPQQRTPITICVDCSYSMRQERRLERVLEGLQEFCTDMAADLIASQSVELCLISYGGTMARVVHDFAPPEQYQTIPPMTAEGATPLLDAVDTALENFERRKRRYSDNGINYNRPWLILIGDGDETAAPKELERTAALLKEESDAKHLKVLCITVGDESRVECASLMKLSPDGKVQYLRDLKFNAFFGWLSRSIQKTTLSLPGEEALYEPETTWGEVLERKE